MENYQKPLTQEEIQKFMAILQQQQESGELSSDSKKIVLAVPSGEEKTIKEIRTNVKIGEDFVPLSSHDEIIHILDCGHSTIDFANVRVCHYGHRLCPEHELEYCIKCGKALCYMDVKKTSDNKPICEKCLKNQQILLVLYILFLIFLFIRIVTKGH